MTMGVDRRGVLCVYICVHLVILSIIANVVCAGTDANDLKILNEFRNGLENPELLKWPSSGNDPCGSSWPHVICSRGRVTQIQIQGLSLKGPLPQDFNRLDQLQNLGLQKNNFYGKLPTFSGLSNLESAYLDDNQFDMIPADFFRGLSSIRVLALDNNPLNKTTGWAIPADLQKSTQLINFTCSGCNIVGHLPDYFGEMPSLTVLKLSRNSFTGQIPNSFRNSMLQVLWLNNQEGDGMTGPIDVVGSMIDLRSLSLQGNRFNGPIPNNIGNLTSLTDLNLNGNQLAGLIPQGLAGLNLKSLDLSGNMLMGPIPKFRAAKVSYSSNSFCQQEPGKPCAPEVNALLQVLQNLNYPPRLATQWTENDPCQWWGVTCNPSGEVSIINLQKLNLDGTLSPALATLNSLVEIRLAGNHMHGQVPRSLSQLTSLRLLDISGNGFDPPLPKFNKRVRVVAYGNPALAANGTVSSPPSPDFPANSFNQNAVEVASPPFPSNTTSTSDSSTKSVIIVTVAVTLASTVFVSLGVVCFCYLWKRRRSSKVMIYPNKDQSDNDIKIMITPDEFSTESGGTESSNVTEAGHLTISLQILRNVTNNFSPKNEIGRGGFGVVYKGVLEDGTQIAVKRMETGIITNQVAVEFQAEIAVLSKVRHRHLVSLLGYSVEGNERLLVYEYMPHGALSKHLFHWRRLSLTPLPWRMRLSIALDVARGMEYLHSLTHQSFIHRDLKSSNILLGKDFRAKVSDFGLVKLAPDRERSVATRLAGTFGYLAPEYAVTGKITTKVDVFSFGVVLMELVMGLTALDESRSEESRYLVEWFWQIKSERSKLIAAIDPALDAKPDIYNSICIAAELAGHCTARDPNHRPDMGHAVNVLAQLVETWKPVEDSSDIDLSLPLPEKLKQWQNEQTGEFSYLSSFGDR